MTLAKIYNLEPDPNPVYGLQIWYNDLIAKNIDNIDEVDIGKMVRQNILIEFAVEKGLEFLEQDHLSGGIYVGEIMEAMYKSIDQIEKNPEYIKKTLKILDEISEKEIDKWEWDSEESKEEYKFWISELKKIKND